jgi:hypothetical protein
VFTLGKWRFFFPACSNWGCTVNAKVLAAFLLVAAGALSTEASATLITYTETVDATGSLNGVAFTDDLLTITAVGDTSSIIGGSGVFVSILPTDFTLSGGGSGAFTDTIQVVSNQNTKVAGFGDNTTNEAILFTANGVFASYDLSTVIGPVSGGSVFNGGVPFATSAGNLVINSVSGNATFTASTGAVPETSTWAMMLIGFAGLGFAGYRQRQKLAGAASVC